MKKENVIKVIEACVLLVIGVLFCVSLAMGTEVLSIILGSSLIVAGVIIVILSAVNDRSIMTPMSLGGLLALSLGIFFIAANAVGFILAVVPYALLVFGTGLIVEAFLAFFARNEKVVPIFVIKLVVGVILVVVGILLLTIPEVRDYVALIVGIALIIIAIDNIALEFIKANRQ